MPRQRSPNRDKAKDMYLNSKGKVVLKEIAAELGVSDTQIRKWKNQDKWDDILKGTLPKQKGTKKSNATNKKANKKKEPCALTVVKSENDELTEKQRLFCIYYIKNFNATQAYLKAYGGTVNTAGVEGYRLLRNPKVKTEIDMMKELKRESIMLTEDDIVERYMRIAFADMTDFIEFGQKDVPIMTKDGPAHFINPDTGEKIILTQRVNTINFKEDFEIDGGLICEISTSRQGAKIKLEDRQRALDWLADYFEMNPEHKHRKAHDEKKLQLDRDRFEHTKDMDERNDF
jgi:phage terminase small subunit